LGNVEINGPQKWISPAAKGAADFVPVPGQENLREIIRLKRLMGDLGRMESRPNRWPDPFAGPPGRKTSGVADQKIPISVIPAGQQIVKLISTPDKRL